MHTNNDQLINDVISNITHEYELTSRSLETPSTKDELIRKLIISETTVQMLKEKIKILEWENFIWNSTNELRVSMP